MPNIKSSSVSLTTQPLAVNLNEACRLLSISRASMYRLLARRLIHPSRALGSMRFSVEELHRFLRDTSTTVNP
jgi:predicted DNA-binding transcriptional regulator AlpA